MNNSYFNYKLEVVLQFLDLFGDAQSIKKADDRHAKFFLPHRSTSETKKRHADDYLSSDKSKLVKSSPAQSVMGAYPSSQNLWPAGYGLQPQTWPQVTQAPGQHWNPAYAQQVHRVTIINIQKHYISLCKL